jgi:hypothetical protein
MMIMLFLFLFFLPCARVRFRFCMFCVVVVWMLVSNSFSDESDSLSRSLFQEEIR